MAEFTKLADITVASVEAYLGIAAGTSTNALITAHLLGATSFVEEYCRHDFQSIARVNEKPCILEGQSDFFLLNYPVASIASLVEDDDTLVEDTDFYVDKETGRVEKISATFPDFNRDEPVYWSIDRNGIVVNYTGGEALTDDVIMVVKELAGIWAGLKKRTYTDNEGVERTSTLNSLPKEFYDILNRHRHKTRC